MKNISMALLLIVGISTLGCARMPASEPIEYMPTPGESATDVGPVRDDKATMSVEVFPTEINLGDAAYVAVYYENRTSGDLVFLPNFSILCSLSSPFFQDDYHWVDECRSGGYDSTVVLPRTIEPGEKYLFGIEALEFPPLDDWGAPFWQELIAKIPAEGTTCGLRVKCGSAEIERDILVKPRPAVEMALLKQWYDDTPETLFPKIEGDRKIPYNGVYLEPSGKSNIRIGGKEYDPWLFVRFGVRKPSDPNNPTTLEGWRELEASLIPSTMRDEVRLTRLQLEYYSAKKGGASEQAKAELVDWLESLPEVQQRRMTTSLVSKMHEFYDSPLRDKNRELMRALYDILDVGSQGIVCNFESIKYNDRALTPPPGVKVTRPFMDVVTPTPEDLVHGSKDLPDGFRIWDVTGDSGAAQIVAQYVKLKESENTLVLKNREGLRFNLNFSSLSEEDKEHARAMSQAAAEKPEGK
jgi:hypothetical protein